MSTSSQADRPSPLGPDPKEAEVLKKEVAEIRKVKSKQTESVKKRDKLIQDLSAQLETTEFKYLNFFFVQRTKAMLRYIVQKGTITRELAKAELIKLGVGEVEAEAVIDALLTTEVIVLQNDILKPTEKGVRFDKFIDHQFSSPAGS